MAHNFNVLKLSYDVLEPIKAPVNPHRDVGILIDINDNPERELNLSGSDLDNIKKSEFDLVDLFQNIYVTPQHIKKERDAEIDLFRTEEEFGSSSSSVACNPNRNTVEVLDKEKSIEKTYSQLLLNQGVQRVLKVPKVTANCENYSVQNKIDYSVVHSIGKLDNDTRRTENVMSINATGIGNVKTLNGITSIGGLLSKSENVGILKKTGNVNSKTLNGICTNDGPSNKYMLKTLSAASDGSFNNKLVPEKPFTIDSSRCIQTTSIVNRPSHNMIMTIALDKKTYTKQKQIKSEIEKIGYTKAPDLCEKSVVLPQIMKRLDERKRSLQVDLKRKVLEAKTGCQCNTASKSNEVNVVQDKLKQVSNTGKAIPLSPKSITLSPVIALENCNRERLVAHRVHSAFQKFVLTGSYY